VAVPVEVLAEESWEEEMTAAGLPYMIAFDARAPVVGDMGIANRPVVIRGSCFAGSAGCK
jgi:hypothetical protein